MAEVTLTGVLPLFPVGTNVDAYVDILADSGDPRPIAPVLDSGVVSADGVVTFEDLPADGTRYVAAALVDGGWRFRYFSTKPLPTALDEETAERQAQDLAERVARENADAALAVEIGEKEPLLGFVPENSANRGLALGYTPLDAGGKVPLAHLPNAIMEFQGMWNAATNTPALANGVGGAGDVYRVSVAGERNLGAGLIAFEVGDYAIYNGATWERSDSTDSVVSVAGKKGAVLLVVGDVENAESILNKDTDPGMAANSDVKYPSQKAMKTALATKPTATLDTDTALAANSDTRVCSQKAIKAYADAISVAAFPQIWRVVETARCRIESDAVEQFYRMSAANPRNVAYNAAYAAAGADTIPDFFKWVAADHAVTGKTTKCKIRATVMTNATKPTITFTVDLHDISVAGAADAFTFNSTGTVAGTQTVPVIQPAASSFTVVESAEFNAPADGLMQFLCLTSGTLTNNSAVVVRADLLVKNV